MDQTQYTFVRGAQAYHADKQTIDVLQAVQQWDAGAAQQLFDRGRETGRIGAGSALALEQSHGPRPPAHGHGQ
jgi:hypothetical protein